MDADVQEQIRHVQDPVRKRALFVALLSKEIATSGERTPVVVGRQAVELYTQGSYTTGDIDLKTPRQITERILKDSGFVKQGRSWLNRNLDIYVDLLGESLDEGPEAEKRVTTIEIGDSLSIRVLSIEDLIIDRLNAAKWWNDADSLMWARILLKVKDTAGGQIDRDYLEIRAQQEGLTTLLRETFSDSAGKD
jgi:hypothetical protein